MARPASTINQAVIIQPALGERRHYHENLVGEPNLKIQPSYATDSELKRTCIRPSLLVRLIPDLRETR